MSSSTSFQPSSLPPPSNPYTSAPRSNRLLFLHPPTHPPTHPFTQTERVIDEECIREVCAAPFRGVTWQRVLDAIQRRNQRHDLKVAYEIILDHKQAKVKSTHLPTHPPTHTHILSLLHTPTHPYTTHSTSFQPSALPLSTHPPTHSPTPQTATYCGSHDANATIPARVHPSRLLPPSNPDAGLGSNDPYHPIPTHRRPAAPRGTSFTHPPTHIHSNTLFFSYPPTYPNHPPTQTTHPGGSIQSPRSPQPHLLHRRLLQRRGHPPTPPRHLLLLLLLRHHHRRPTTSQQQQPTSSSSSSRYVLHPPTHPCIPTPISPLPNPPTHPPTHPPTQPPPPPRREGGTWASNPRKTQPT